MDNEKEIKDLTSRELIIEAALTEFAEEGIAGARVDRIAEAARVNKAMIYYHFKSKEKLYEEVFTQHVFRKLSRLLKSFDESESLEGVLTSITTEYGEIFKEGDRFRKLLTRELANPDSAIIDQLAVLLRESGIPGRLYMALEQAQKRGELREMNILQNQISFIIMNLGSYIMFPLFQKVLDIPDRNAFFTERGKTVVDLFLNGVRK